jgi:hypothetical protein
MEMDVNYWNEISMVIGCLIGYFVSWDGLRCEHTDELHEKEGKVNDHCCQHNLLK